MHYTGIQSHCMNRVTRRSIRRGKKGVIRFERFWTPEQKPKFEEFLKRMDERERRNPAAATVGNSASYSQASGRFHVFRNYFPRLNCSYQLAEFSAQRRAGIAGASFRSPVSRREYLRRNFRSSRGVTAAGTVTFPRRPRLTVKIVPPPRAPAAAPAATASPRPPSMRK